MAVTVVVDHVLERSHPEEAYRDDKRLDALVSRALAETASVEKGIADSAAGFVKPGQTVLLKPNWVLHWNPAGHGTTCLVTQLPFVLSVVREVVKARPARLIIGDAPVQGCIWSRLVTEEFCRAVGDVAKAAGVALEIVDFRRTIAVDGRMVNGVRKDLRDLDRFVRFDLESHSLLEPISFPPGRFRVASYDPRALARTHRPGCHQYILCREAFEADVILSLPKLKTHYKSGLTGALKNLVGINGSKDYLPHFRCSSPDRGGDCYPTPSLRKRIAEFCLDQANQHIGRKAYGVWRRLAFCKVPGLEQLGAADLDGAWYGNDTTWRMVLDLNRILRYGRSDGSMADAPVRRIITLTDAIVCGQGNGPLGPDPVTLGTVTCAASCAAADFVHAALLGFDPAKVPLVRESLQSFRWPLVSRGALPWAKVNGREMEVDELADRIGRTVTPPAGWAGHIEWQRTQPRAVSI